MTRQAYVDDDRKLLIFWSPKCGCSAIVEWWYAGPVGKAADEEEVPRAKARHWLHSQGYERRLKQLARLDLPAFHKIVIARHPFDRAVSAYIDKFVGRHGRWKDEYQKLEGFAAEFWRQIRGVDLTDHQDSYDGLTFLEFLEAINERVLSRGDSEPKLNSHWNTQVPFAFDMAPPYDDVYDIQELTGALSKINDIYGFTYVPGVRRSIDYGSFDGQFAGDISSLTLAREGRRLNRRNFYSAETEKMIRSAYDIDFRTFSYT